jgi:hypothetical protein
MASEEEMAEAKAFREAHTIAVVGCSRDPAKPSGYVPRYLQANGFRIIPINPMASEILGEKCYKGLFELAGEDIDVVDVFRPSSEAPGIVSDALKTKAKVVWLQEGITSGEAGRMAKEHGLIFIEGKCMMQEHMRLSREKLI